ncbi:MAG: DUF4150 domain-containing protein [Enhygromyxa sp.]
MADVFANSRSIVHTGDGLQHASATPDVCKTPSPGGPVPVPYPNLAASRDLAKGTKRVKIGGNSVAVEGAQVKTSVGDEPGTAGGGLVSGKTKGKMTWGSVSANVKFEGKGVVRYADVTQHNGNTFNAAFVTLGGTGLAYADDFVGLCPICSQGPERHRILEKEGSSGKAAELLRALREGFEAAGSDAERRGYAYHNPGRPWGGYMIGVMACKCESPKFFCANSGPEFPGVRSAASKVGMEYIGGGIVSVPEFIKANGSNLSRSLKKFRIEKMWKNLKPKSKEPGYSPFGNCAAAKLVARCSHAPAEMTELFFAPPGGSWKGRYNVLATDAHVAHLSKRRLKRHPDWAQQVLANRKATLREFTFNSNGMSVASCNTCQQSLYLTMCPERVCSGS